METITFYSYKGGVGRTLAIANAATYLALLGQKVVAIDFDLEAPGLHYKLLPEGTEVPCGLIDYIHDALDRADQAVPNVEKYVVKVASHLRASGPSGEMWLLPAGAAPSPGYWRKLSQVNWYDFLYKEGSEGPVFFLELKEAIRRAFNPDVLLIDSRTGITEIGGVATTLLADKVVCLLLHNRESLEGTRVVLQALLGSSLRPPGAQPVQIIPVISRHPTDVDLEAERKTIEQVKAFLNEKLEHSDGPTFKEVLVLHNDPVLSATERVLVGGEITPEKSPLLRDYLRLFAKTINPDVIRRNFNPIIESALNHLLDSPDEAQRELENLAFSFNVAAAYRELLKIYRLRNVEGDVALRAAQQLWHFGDQSDLPLIMSLLRKHFKEVYRWRQKSYELDFVEDVWRKSGASDARIAMDLAESFNNLGQSARALALLEEAWRQSDKDNDLLARYLHQLARLRRWDDARHLVDLYRVRCLENPASLLAWARMEVASDEENLPEEMLQPSVLQRIEEQDPVLALELLAKAGPTEEWEKRVVAALERALQKEDELAVYRVGQLCRAHGQWDTFRQLVRKWMGDVEAERALEAIMEQAAHRMPERWLRERHRF